MGRGLQGAIHLQYDEPGSGGIDLAWPEKLEPQACLDYIQTWPPQAEEPHKLKDI